MEGAECSINFPIHERQFNVNCFISQRRHFLLTLLLHLPPDSLSPLSSEWTAAPAFLAETSLLLRNIYHRWRVNDFCISKQVNLFGYHVLFPILSFQCYKYRLTFDQTARNRMREKVTASIIFKDRKSSYPRRFVDSRPRKRLDANDISFIFMFQCCSSVFR